MRVHELAKEFGISSKELIERLAKLRVTVKGHMSTVNDEAVAKLRAQAKGSASAGTRASAGAAPSAASSRAAAPAKPGAKPAKSDAKVEATPKPSGPPIAAKHAMPAAKPAAPAPAKPSERPVASPPPVRPVAAPKSPEPVAKPAIPAPAARPVAPTPSAKPATPVPPPAPAAPERRPEPAKPSPSAVPSPAPVLASAGVAVAAAPELKQVRLTFPISVKDLAAKLDIKANDLIKHLIGKRIFASLTQMLDQGVATQVAKDFSFEVAPQPTLEERLVEAMAPDPAKMVVRAPVVTLMGHVDHGKTSLLDAIRKSSLAEKETGGITQHIGAYEVQLPKGSVTFLDTPGHEAFTALRARGAQVTDVVVLVVAADDGVMPQTIEAIDHARAANVPIVVAINKIDRPEANPQRVKQQLAQHGLQAEDWGGKTIMVPVSARTGEGIDGLLDMLLLEAEMLELKADPSKAAQGTVVEARQSSDRGPIATVLVQQGTLRVGDMFVIETITGRVRAMINDRGQRVKEARPATAVEVLGLPSVPSAGAKFIVVTDEKLVRGLVERRQDQLAQRSTIVPRRVTLDDLHQRITEGTIKELKLIVKSDVDGSLDAITRSLEQIPSQEVKLNVLHVGVGDVSESDIMLAAASDAVVIGFRVGIDPRVQVEAIKQGVDVRIFQIIYELVNEIRSSIEGLLEPKIEETFLGRAEVKRLFQISKVGIVAGCFVTKGTIRRDAVIRVIRGRERIVETKIANLKRVKDDVREVQEGVECGISLEGNTDLQPGDLVEAWELKKVARKLG